LRHCRSAELARLSVRAGLLLLLLVMSLGLPQLLTSRG
jgi:hypothetical protein